MRNLVRAAKGGDYAIEIPLVMLNLGLIAAIVIPVLHR
jgi:hypothetical protein